MYRVVMIKIIGELTCLLLTPMHWRQRWCNYYIITYLYMYCTTYRYCISYDLIKVSNNRVSSRILYSCYKQDLLIDVSSGVAKGNRGNSPPPTHTHTKPPENLQRMGNSLRLSQQWASIAGENSKFRQIVFKILLKFYKNFLETLLKIFVRILYKFSKNFF